MESVTEIGDVAKLMLTLNEGISLPTSLIKRDTGKVQRLKS